MVLKSTNNRFENISYDDSRFNNLNVASWQKPLMQFALNNSYIQSFSSFTPNQAAYRNEIFDYAQRAMNNCTQNTN
jgi:ABC-type arginine/histidine transport system permease subunit